MGPVAKFEGPKQDLSQCEFSTRGLESHFNVERVAKCSSLLPSGVHVVNNTGLEATRKIPQTPRVVPQV